MITFDNALVGTGNTNTFSIPFAIGNNPNTTVLLAITITNAATTVPTVPTLGGTNMNFVAQNVGPIINFGQLVIYALPTFLFGSQTISFNTNLDTTQKCYAIYSYYNTSGIDVVSINQGSYSSSFVSNTLTGTQNNTLMWTVSGAQDTNGVTPSITGGTNNINTTSGTTIIGASDFGLLPTPTSETATAGRNPGTGVANVALLSLLPIFPPATATGGSFLTQML